MIEDHTIMSADRTRTDRCSSPVAAARGAAAEARPAAARGAGPASEAGPPPRCSVQQARHSGDVHAGCMEQQISPDDGEAAGRPQVGGAGKEAQTEGAGAEGGTDTDAEAHTGSQTQPAFTEADTDTKTGAEKATEAGTNNCLCPLGYLGQLPDMALALVCSYLEGGPP